jgi:hypothetical protein
LVLRWATAEDAQELAEFNFRHHNDDPAGQPETWLKDWTGELLDGSHPTTGPQDVTVVVDEKAGGKIVSANFLISQTWRYDDIPFACGMPELIATDADYRRRGLIRQQMAVIHALSEQKGELAQVIGGIPWYYRQFGYDMALDMGGGLRVPLTAFTPLPESETERFRLRPAEMSDLPDLKQLYASFCENSLITCLRDDAIWRYEIQIALEKSGPTRHMEMIETAEGQTIGYIQLHIFPAPHQINELVLRPGYSLRDVCYFLGRDIKARIEALERENKPTLLYFSLGEEHPAYEALGQGVGSWRHPYAWFVRVPDLARFLKHIRPVLEKRLANSVMAGHSGSLKLNFYTNQLKIDIEAGKITAVEPYSPNDFFDFDAFFPDLTFLTVLFGRRTIQELRHVYPDCYPRNVESALLLNSLFPKQSSRVISLN